MTIAIKTLTVIIPAQNEEGCLKETLESLSETLRRADIPFEIVVVDDNSVDSTWEILTRLKTDNAEIHPVQNPGEPGFGNGVRFGLSQMTGDAAVVFMADQSDSPEDVVHYWKKLNEGYDCVFGSRFIKGGSVIDYPKFKYLLNRVANKMVQILFRIKLNDTTNAFKAYRKEVIEGCQPLLSPHFNLTVELPLKAIIRGYSWTTVPISWRNRKSGTAKFKIKEMGSRYIFIILYAWLEKFFSRGDYHRSNQSSQTSKPEEDPTK